MSRLFPSALLFSSPMVLVTTIIMPLAAAASSCSSQSTCGACINVDGGPFDKCGWCSDGKGGGVCKKGSLSPSFPEKCEDEKNCWQKPPSFKKKGTCQPTCSGTTCSECVASSAPSDAGRGSCGWCESTRTCYWTTDAFGSGCGHKCPSWTKNCLKTSKDTTEPFDSCPAVECSTMATCSKCADNHGCSWCAVDQKCVAAASTGNVGCQKCSGGGFCKKYDNTAQCPDVKCSSKSDCTTCANTPGCGWDAQKLACSEYENVDKSIANNCERSSPYGCFYKDPGLCPTTPTQLCSFHKDCRECTTDVACGWSSSLQECVEAARSLPTSESLGACRGGTPFSYFDCEPQCNSHFNCTACHQDPAGCTMCSGEQLFDKKQKINRCVLRQGAMTGPGDPTTPMYPHVCHKVVQKKECDECSSLSDPNVGKKKFPDKNNFPAGDVCSECLANSECGLCTSFDGSATKCMRGNQYGSFDRSDGSCSDPGPWSAPSDFHRTMNWQHEGAGNSFDDQQCGNNDLCSHASTCEQCFDLNGTKPHKWSKNSPLKDWMLLCTWCKDALPLDGSKQSPCRSTRHPEKLCAAKDRMATRDQCSLYNECDGTDCLSCLGSGMESGGVAATTRRDCGWDVAAKTCNSTSTPYSYTTFPTVWGDAKMCPEVCGAHTTCAECGAADGCGWCGGGGGATTTASTTTSTTTSATTSATSGSCLPAAADGSAVNFQVTGQTCVPFDSNGECKGGGGGAGGVVAAVFITIAVVTVGMWVGAIVALRRGALPSCVAQSPCMGCVTKSSQMLPGGDAAGDGEGNYKDLNTVLS